MAVTFQEMVGFVRLQADADSVDAPDSVLQVHARMGYRNILDRRDIWPHLRVAYTFTSVANQATYSFATFSGGTDMDRVASIVCTDYGVNGFPLTFLTRADAQELYGIVPVSREYPEAFTLDDGKITLWPTPSTPHDFTVEGYRAPAAWPNGVGSTPDLPDVFHDSIQWFMLSGYYMSQEDTAMAGAYLTEFEQMVAKALRGFSGKTYPASAMVVGGSEKPARPRVLKVV